MINMKTMLMISKMIQLDTLETAFTLTASAIECLDPKIISRIKGFHQDRNLQAVHVLNLVLEVGFSREPLSKANSNNRKFLRLSSKPESPLIETTTKTKRKLLRLVPRDSFHLLIRDHLALTISWTQIAKSSRT